MRRRTLGDTLRALVLATPFVGAAACCLSTGADDDAGLASCSFSSNFEMIPVPDGGFGTGGCMAYCDARLSGVQDCQVNYQDPAFFCCCCGGSCCNTGRRPASLIDAVPRCHSSNPIGGYFRKAARLEAASVEAFRLLALELCAHRAPQQLLSRAYRAAREELRHARLTRTLARRFGAAPAAPVYGPSPAIRPLEEVAIENAVEGCARETFGAAVGIWQARHASDATIRVALARIADDETRHAELSWEVARWATPRLPRIARLRVADARSKAFDQLDREAFSAVPPSLVTVAGLPSPAIARHLVQEVRAAVRQL